MLSLPLLFSQLLLPRSLACLRALALCIAVAAAGGVCVCAFVCLCVCRASRKINEKYLEKFPKKCLYYLFVPAFIFPINICRYSAAILCTFDFCAIEI